MDQHWDVTIPLIVSEEDITDDDAEDNSRFVQQRALEGDVDPVEFLVVAAREDRPLGIALNGVPFFSALTVTGVITFLQDIRVYQ